MQKKYEMLPPATEANWVLLSMHTILGIKAYLKHFPGIHEPPENQWHTHPRACSASLLWSGTAGNNVPINTYKESTIGFVLNSSLIEVPQADLFAYRSGGMVKKEYLKTDIVLYGDYGSSKTTSKYPQKAGYTRTCCDQDTFCTNLAKNEHLPGEKKLAIYHPQGEASIFAKNIWRKYFKRPTRYRDDNGVMTLNEALVFQKHDNQNPIAGLIIQDTPTIEIAKELLTIMEQYPSLNLYLYNQLSTNHIIRVLSNKQGCDFLNSNSCFKTIFHTITAPFQGFDLESKPLPATGASARIISSSAGPVNPPSNQDSLAADFQLRCIHALIAIGLALLALTIATSAPVATALGIAGAVTANCFVASGIASVTSFLVVAGIYAVRTTNRDSHVQISLNPTHR